MAAKKETGNTLTRSPEQKEFSVATIQEFVKRIGGKRTISRVTIIVIFYRLF